MRADITRSTFRPAKRFNGVRMQQGRVQLDADWNEQLDIQAHLDETTALDIIGACGVPEDEGGFQVGITPDGKDLDLTAGRIYVDGILCENFGEPVAVTAIDNQGMTLANLLLDGSPLRQGDWVEISVPQQGQPPSLSEVQVKSIDNKTGRIAFVTPGNYPGGAGITARRVATYLRQPDLPSPPFTQAGPPVALNLGDGDYLAYLDVWRRGLTAHEDLTLLEQALGGPDTAYRSKTVWQLRLIPIVNPNNAPEPCDIDFPDWDALINPQPGALAAQAKTPDQQSGDPLCLLPPGSNYNGLENQLYRVEIHKPGPLGTATFKWSRENGSVEARWTDLAGAEVKVDSTGRDSVLGFTGAGSIELVDDALELSSATNPVGLIKGYTVADDTTLVLPGGVNPAAPDPTLNPRVRRWENDVEVVTSANWIPLERGVEVQFADGGAGYQTGDYWLIPARTASGIDAGDIEWPVDPTGAALFKAPDGVRHHYCRLAVVQVANQALSLPAGADCRVQFPSLTTLDAEDIAYTGTCVGAGETVESALDFLCANTDIPDHNLHLHGTGIVCGLQVNCVGASDKRVEVKSGYAIAASGAVVKVADQQFNVIDSATAYDAKQPQGAPVIITDTTNGNGEAALFLTVDNENGWGLAVEPFDPAQDTPQSRLDGTLLKNIYDDCIHKLQVWLQNELADPNNTTGVSKADQLKAALTNLGYQAVNPSTGQNIFLSLREHQLLLEFYNGLKAELQSDTYCAMFNNARKYPDYASFKALQNLGMDTVFGTGTRSRMRLRPNSNEAYTFGGGLNPLQPSTTINQFNLKTGQLINVLDPVAGVTLQTGQKASGGTDAVRDVAFAGNYIFAIIPTRNGQDTIIRPGTMVGSNITWMSQTTLCGVKLVTLATTPADPKHLYAIGEGSGLYQIDYSKISQITATLVGTTFPAVGHLRMDGQGRAYATSGDYKNARYSSVVAIDLTGKPVGTTQTFPDGQDDIAIDGTHVFVVTGLKSSSRQVMSYSMDTLVPAIGKPMPIFPGGAQLEYYAPKDQLMIAEAGDLSLRIMSASNPAPPSQNLLPMQVTPVAIATDSKNVYVLNDVSNTIITITDAGTLLDPAYDSSPLVKDLAAYRAAALEAYADLAGGFAEYLKDCLCDHLLVDCPDPSADPRLYLGTVRIRGLLVDRICNLNKRRYVKSFPTVGYWLSLFPVLPLIKWAIARFCCITIPDTMSNFTAQSGGSGAAVGSGGSNPIETLQHWLGTAQNVDLFGFLGTALSGGGLFGKLIQEAFVPTNGPSPQMAPPAATSEPQPGPAAGGAAIAGQPTRTAVANLKAAGVSVEVTPYRADPNLLAPAIGSYFTDPPPGSTVTLHEQAGTVKAYTVMPAGPAADLHAQVDALREGAQAKDAQIAQLQSQLSELQVQQAQLLAVQRQHLEMFNALQASRSAAGVAEPVAEVAEPAVEPTAPRPRRGERRRRQ